MHGWQPRKVPNDGGDFDARGDVNDIDDDDDDDHNDGADDDDDDDEKHLGGREAKNNHWTSFGANSRESEQTDRAKKHFLYVFDTFVFVYACMHVCMFV